MPNSKTASLIKLQLAQAVHDFIVGAKLTQTEAANMLHTTQPRISYLMSKHVDLFTIDIMIRMLEKLNHRIIINCAPSKKKSKNLTNNKYMIV